MTSEGWSEGFGGYFYCGCLFLWVLFFQVGYLGTSLDCCLNTWPQRNVCILFLPPPHCFTLMLIAVLNLIFSFQAEIFLIHIMNAMPCRSQPCTLNPVQIYHVTRKQEQEGLLQNWYNFSCWINLFLWLFLYWQQSQKVSDWMFMHTCVLFCDFCPWIGSEISLVHAWFVCTSWKVAGYWTRQLDLAQGWLVESLRIVLCRRKA